MRRKITFWGIAILMAAVLLLPCFLEGKPSERYDIVFWGDSITGNAPEGGSIPDLVGQRLGKTSFNAAMGGTSLSYSAEAPWESYVNREWCMVRLVDAVCSRDFQVQRATLPYGDRYRDTNLQTTHYFEKRLEELSRIDFSRVELLILAYGANDYNSGQRTDDPEDPYNVMTFGGALRYGLRELRERFPNLRILLVAPVYSEVGGKPCYATDRGGGIQDRYVELERQIAEEYGVEWLNAYEESGIWEDTARIFLEDDLHLTKEGIERMAGYLSEYLEGTME